MARPNIIQIDDLMSRFRILSIRSATIFFLSGGAEAYATPRAEGVKDGNCPDKNFVIRTRPRPTDQPKVGRPDSLRGECCPLVWNLVGYLFSDRLDLRSSDGQLTARWNREQIPFLRRELNTRLLATPI